MCLPHSEGSGPDDCPLTLLATTDEKTLGHALTRYSLIASKLAAIKLTATLTADQILVST